MTDLVSRRQLLRSGALIGGGIALNAMLPAWARSETQGLGKPLPTVSGTDIALAIGHTPFAVDGRTGHAITINGTVPAPLVRLKEGQTVRLKFIRNEYTSCTREVVFPTLGIRRQLPPKEEVVIDLGTLATGEIPFHCGMEMIHGLIVVEAKE